MDNKTLAPFKIIREGQYIDRKTPQNRAQQLKEKALSHDILDAEDAVMHYFASGGKIGRLAASEQYGVSGNAIKTERNIKGEAEGRSIIDLSKEGISMEKIAEEIHRDLKHMQDVIDYDDILKELEIAVGSLYSASDAQQRIVDKYEEKELQEREDAEQQLTDEEKAQLDTLSPE